jgi:4-amino-4-deoxy-L-arabinose transferase-like glycosyltransferase
MIQRMISRHPLAADLLLLLAIGVAALFSFLGQNRHWASREIRHAEIMREMSETGDFLIPRLMGEVYYDKPPVMHCLGAILMRVSGNPNLFQARFPSAFAALLSLFAVYGLGRLLGDRRVGWWGALALLSMPGFWIMARMARPDLTLVAFILLSCLFLGWAMRLPNGAGKAGWLIASGVASALAVITKGPYGVMVPLLFLAFAPRSNHTLVRPGWRFLWFGLGMVLMLAGWSWPVYLRDGGEYLRGVVFQKDLSSAGGSGHYRAFYWYLGPGFLNTLPVILFLPLAIRQWRREKQFPAALAITAVIFLVLCCVPGKRPHYLLPLFPFLALGLASGIAYVAQNHRLLRRLAIVAVVGGIAAGPLYYGPILRWLRPQGDSEWSFITDVARTLPPNATVVCFGAKYEYLAWVRRDHRRIIAVANSAEAKAALQAGDGDRYLVAPEEDLLALERDADLASLRPVLDHNLDHKERWFLAHLDN